MQSKCTFEDTVALLEEDIDVVVQASRETKGSGKFRNLLGIIRFMTQCKPSDSKSIFACSSFVGTQR